MVWVRGRTADWRGVELIWLYLSGQFKWGSLEERERRGEWSELQKEGDWRGGGNERIEGERGREKEVEEDKTIQSISAQRRKRTNYRVSEGREGAMHSTTERGGQRVLFCSADRWMKE